MLTDKVVYYAIDDHTKYLRMTEISIRSLRTFNSHIPVLVFIFGKWSAREQECFQKLGAQVVFREVRTAPEKTFLKWLPLDEISALRVIFLDADTLFFDNVEKLFNRYSKRDLYAREEACCSKTEKIRPQVDHAQILRLRQKFKSRTIPIFNTGVIVFNSGIHREIAKKKSQILALGLQYYKRRMNYPSDNRHIIEEIAATIVLGTVPKIKCGLIQPQASPWYIEWRNGTVNSPGIVVHSWTSQFYYLAVAASAYWEQRTLSRHKASDQCGALYTAEMA